MCGLVGLAGNCSHNIKEVFNELLLVDVLRGHHSTGAAVVKREGSQIFLEKAPIPSPAFIGTKGYQDLIKEVGLKVMIGHNRYATVGEKTAANAHPFQFPGVVGAHNGTIKEWSLRTLDKAGQFGTDSETVFYNISTNGLKKTVGELEGAWALTYFQEADNTINLIRNKERPLFYCYTADRETLLWASEAEMLEWILKRHKMKIFADEIYEVEADRHYRWTLPEKAADKFDKPVLAVVEGYKYSFTGGGKYTNYHYGTAYGNTGHPTVSTNRQHLHTTSNVRTFVPSKGSKTKIDTKKFRPPYKDAYGKIVNKVQFEKLVACGCVFCDKTDIKWGSFIQPLKDDMEGRKLFLCEECYNDNDIRELVEQAL